MNAAQTIAANPFSLMMDPQQVFSAIEESSTLRNLRQQQYLLLDRPAGAGAPAAARTSDLAAFDAELDAEVPLEEESLAEEAPVSESVAGSHNYQSFPRVFN